MTDAPAAPTPPSGDSPPSPKQVQAGLAKSLFADIASDLDDLAATPTKRERAAPAKEPAVVPAAVPSEPEPVAAEPEAVEPEAVELEPLAPTPEAVVPTPEPVLPTPEAVAPTTEPVGPTTEPVSPRWVAAVAPRREEVAPKPEAVAPTPEPVTPTPEAVAPTPEPVVATPQAVAPTPVAAPPKAKVVASSPPERVPPTVASSSPPDSSGPGKRGRSLMPWLVAVGAVLVVAVVAATAGLLDASSSGPFAPAVDTSDWTGVLMSNNDVFFGHVKQITTDQIELTNVYYLQTPSTTDKTQSVAIVSLVANQIQCPKDDIIINRADVAYWEELQATSYVVQRLDQLGQTPQTCYAGPAASPAPTGGATLPIVPTP